MAREIGDRQGEAASLGSLGNAYYSLGQYQQAIDFHQQYLVVPEKPNLGSRCSQKLAIFHGSKKLP
ncbi:MAG: tetratricopeptide repeat protein [Phormidesmis sp.]